MKSEKQLQDWPGSQSFFSPLYQQNNSYDILLFCYKEKILNMKNVRRSGVMPLISPMLGKYCTKDIFLFIFIYFIYIFI
jgi:hypothetical protein